MKVNDKMVSFLEARLDIEEIVHTYFPEWQPDGMVVCPFHDDTKASLHISPEGKAKCHSGQCGWSASNIIDFFSKIEGVTYDKARWLLYEMVVKTIPESRVDTYKKQIWGGFKSFTLGKAPCIRYLLNTRKLGSTTIGKYGIGYDTKTKRITIPIYDQFNRCVNIRKIGWTKKQRDFAKALNTKGYGKVRLYPENQIINEKKIVLVEGEWDMLIGRQAGLPTATWTGGAGGWNDEFAWLFQDKIVFILYDNDRAGVEGAYNQELRISEIADWVEVCSPLSLNVGKDLSEWYGNRVMGMDSFVDHVINFELPVNTKTKKVKRCPCCGQIIKEEI